MLHHSESLQWSHVSAREFTERTLGNNIDQEVARLHTTLLDIIEHEECCCEGGVLDRFCTLCTTVAVCDACPGTFLSLRWLSEEEGGRAHPPSGLEYRGVAIAEGAQTGWSVRLLFFGNVTRAEVTFLMAEAAGALGDKFWLVEGARRVAEARVVRPSFR